VPAYECVATMATSLLFYNKKKLIVYTHTHADWEGRVVVVVVAERSGGGTADQSGAELGNFVCFGFCHIRINIFTRIVCFGAFRFGFYDFV